MNKIRYNSPAGGGGGRERHSANVCYWFAVFAGLFIFAIMSQIAKAQTEMTPPAEQSEQAEEEYSESALRRFEIITLSSFPFAAVHSYFAVRGVKMIRENKISPVLYPKDYRRIGIGAVSLALIIGVWDWLNTRNKDRTASRVPTRPPAAPPDKGDGESDGSIASLRQQMAIGSRLSESIGRRSLETSMNCYSEDSEFLTISLLQLRF